MSTVPEVIVAAHCGMDVLGFSLIANAAAGVVHAPLSGEEVIETAKKKGREFAQLIETVLSHL